MNKISAGKDLEDEGITLNDVDKALQKVGISLKDENGILRSSADILDEVSEKWDTLNRNQQSQVATAIAGTNQANIFRATMADYKEVIDATTIAQNANGSATERMATYTESLEAKISAFKTAWAELVNNLDLYSLFGVAIDAGTKLIEFLDALLNKIELISPALKAALTAQGINIAGLALAKVFATISGQNGIGGLLTGLVSLESIFNAVSTAMNAASASGVGFVGTLGSMLTGMSSVIGVGGTLVAVLAAIGVAVYAASKAYDALNVTAEETLEDATKKAQESQQELDDIQSQISSISAEIDTLLGKDTLTFTDEQELANLREQLAVLKEIEEAKRQVAENDKEAQKDAQRGIIDEKYSYSNNYNDYASNTGQVSADELNSTQILKELEDIKSLREQIREQGEEYDGQFVNLLAREKQLTDGLQEQLVVMLEDKNTLIDIGEKGSETYDNLQEKIDLINIALDPDNWVTLKLDELIDFKSIERQLAVTGADSAKIYTEAAEKAAKKIMANGDLQEQFSQIFDATSAEEYAEVLRNYVIAGLQDTTTAAEELNDALNTFETSGSGYVDALSEMKTETEEITNAYQEMNDQGYLSVDIAKDLITKYPELSKCLEIQNGKIKINVEYLKEQYNATINSEKATLEAEKEKTQAVLEQTKIRIQAIKAEIMATGPGGTSDMNEGSLEDNLRAATQSAKDYQAQLDIIEEQLKALNQLGAAGISYTPKSSSSSGKTAAEKEEEARKEAYETEKSRFELTKQQLELEKDKVEAQKTDIENQKSAVELVKSRLELEKEQAEQQLENIEDTKDGLTDIIELIEDMVDQKYEDLKDGLEVVQDVLSSLADTVGDIADEYDDIVDSAIEALEAQKEAEEVADSIAEKAQSVADIQAQLAEIQYDDSADAANTRAELVAELNEAQGELDDEIEDAAFDNVIDALEATKEQVDDAYSNMEDVLNNLADMVGSTIDFIDETLQSDAMLYQQAIALFNSEDEQVRQELYNSLIQWNADYGDHINETITAAWEDALDAVEKYKEAAGSTNIEDVTQYLAQQETDLNNTIDGYDAEITKLDNTISQFDIQVDECSIIIDQFTEKINAVSTAMSQLEINYNTETLSKQNLTAATEEEIEALAGLETKTDDASTSLDSLDYSAGNAQASVGDFTTVTGDTSAAITTLGDSAEGAASALSQIESASGTTGASSGLSWGSILSSVLSGDNIGNVAASLITRYLPSLLKAGANMIISSNHEGTGYVEKSDSWLDDMLGLGSDETARVLKVGEAVIPEYANNSSIQQTDTPWNAGSFGAGSSNVTNSNSSLNIDMGDIDVSGIDSSQLKSELESIKQEAADNVYDTILRYIKVYGYRNVASRYN